MISKNEVIVVGITGGVGAGKSAVLEYMHSQYYAAVIEADKVAHDLMRPGGVNYYEIIRTFGQEILAEDGSVDRKKLGELVFSDRGKLQLLNEITHPNIRKEIISRIDLIKRSQKTRFICLEAALLIEENYLELLDELWYVYADEATRISRLKESRGYSEEHCRRMIRQQSKEEAFKAACTRIIDNSHSFADTKEQLDEIMRK